MNEKIKKMWESRDVEMKNLAISLMRSEMSIGDIMMFVAENTHNPYSYNIETDLEAETVNIYIKKEEWRNTSHYMQIILW